MFNKFLKILLLAMSPLLLISYALEVGDDGLHKTRGCKIL